MTSRPPEAAVIGWVDGRPVPRAVLDQRVAGLRGGPFGAALPLPGTAEARQLSRWLTQVILTEVLCETSARASRLAPAEGPPLDRLAAVELGSINAAAYQGSPWVRAVFEQVTAGTPIPPEWRARPSRPEAGRAHHVRHRLFPDRPAAERATPDDLDPLGPVDLASLPAALADALSRHPPGALVGPVPDPLGWHVALATPAPLPHSSPEGTTPPVPTPSLQQHRQAARRRAFARWLDEARAERIVLVPGLEHPGDPRQPDNHHKH
ncbi:peptidylprolyl isomerase [Nonomuraea sp. NPDC050783]|uniref:peptidylprolyl isomerase n=1 Tax=Nonomuraea sp. NPDC050783 TaxID=3154634 RepID=UPI003465CB23